VHCAVGTDLDHLHLVLDCAIEDAISSSFPSIYDEAGDLPEVLDDGLRERFGGGYWETVDACAMIPNSAESSSTRVWAFVSRERNVMITAASFLRIRALLRSK
jgi:hypothetical protein